MRFGALLRDVAEGLEAPHYARVRILEELSADLEDLYEALRAQGLTAAEARRRAQAALAPTPEVASALAYVHRPLLTRLVERYSDRTRHGLERSMLALLTVAMMVLASSGLSAAGLPGGGSPALVLVLCVGGGAAALSVRAMVRLYIGTGRVAAGVRSMLWMLPAAAGGALAIALLDMLLGLARTATAIRSDPAHEAALVLDWVRATAAVNALALLVTLGCAQAWMFLVGRLARMEEEQSAALGRTLRTTRGGATCSS